MNITHKLFSFALGALIFAGTVQPIEAGTAKDVSGFIGGVLFNSIGTTAVLGLVNYFLNKTDNVTTKAIIQICGLAGNGMLPMGAHLVANQIASKIDNGGTDMSKGYHNALPVFTIAAGVLLHGRLILTEEFKKNRIFIGVDCFTQLMGAYVAGVHNNVSEI